MELVYLWVDNYKNIHQQGFNFSPRFKCRYDEDSKELTIDENKEYIHIFPENINVTAIVGKNGSGKSSLFEKLYASLGTRFYIIFSNNQFEIYTSLENITIINTTTKVYRTDKGRFPQIHFSWDILHYEPVLDWSSWMTTNPNILLTMLGTFSHPEYIDLNSYQNNSVIKYIEIFTESEINIFPFSPNKINIKLFIKKEQNEWNFENIKEKIEELKFPKEEVDSKKDTYFRTIKGYVEKYMTDDSNEKNFTLEEYSVLLNEFEDMKEVLSRFPSFILDMYDNEISFFGLSHGERSVLLSNALIFEAVMSSGKQDILICLDEPDLSLHPEWQKKYLNEIVNMFSKVDKSFHFLITSHSPFILSDIPKENVIFLQNGKQDKTVTIDTFGANIHTLLSHGFFMEEGLMGEFAKEKINEVIKLLKNKTKLSQNNLRHCENIISIIGEPILQKTLQNMLNEKKSSHLTILEKLKIQQKEIEDQIKTLEKHQ